MPGRGRCAIAPEAAKKPVSDWPKTLARMPPIAPTKMISVSESRISRGTAQLKRERANCSESRPPTRRESVQAPASQMPIGTA